MESPHTLAKLLGVAVPVIQAATGGSTCPALAAAVSNAGGLGMLAVSRYNTEHLRAILRETRAVTTRPFGINLVLEWEQEDRLRVCLEEGVRIVSLFWGEPNGLWKIAQDAGAIVLHQLGSLDEAKRSRDAGTDAIVVQGWEAGGHVRGTTASTILLPAVVEAMPDTPVIAAGGIADARGVAAALALGASGVWVGTRFVASVESAAHPWFKQRIVEANAEESCLTMAFDGGWPNAPHRVIRNTTLEMWERAGSPPRGQRPGEGEVVASLENGKPIHRYDDTPPLAGATGNVEALALYAGQSAGLIHSILPAADIVAELASAFPTML